jgi:hypothetical protein
MSCDTSYTEEKYIGLQAYSEIDAEQKVAADRPQAAPVLRQLPVLVVPYLINYTSNLADQP